MNLKLLKIARFFHLINKKNYNEKRQIEIVKNSPLFDAKWYLAQNPDVKAKKIGAAKHYVKYGWKEGRNPSPDFDNNQYLEQYEELWSKGICPLFHFELENKKGLKKYKNNNILHKKDQVEQIYPIMEYIKNALEVPYFENPKVSIIIPVYNNYYYTKLCIASIIENTKEISYEVIVADDNSSDETIYIGSVIKNIRVIRNNENLRFLRNCNRAARYAKGEYIVLLNNDTQVQPKWLTYLVETIEKDNQIGLVGSKLIYPDGKLQEAGGIIYSDASGCNYGKNDNPNNLWYNYVKEVDYISGASILLRKKLWDELNGFDETFCPAYYEDTDLSFRIRYEKGLKVVYQPKSVVIHFEGKSNGTDITSGQKGYQKINREKFFYKWKKELRKFHSNSYNSNFLSREHALSKKNILVIDWKILSFTKDTGSRTTWQYMKFFRDMGLNVKFYPHDWYIEDDFLEQHLQEGFEVIHQNFEDYIKTYGQYFDYVYLNRPNIASHYIDLLRKYTKAKIIYQCHDLHYLRQYRIRKLEKNNQAESLYQEEKKEEFNIFRKMDIVCSFSFDEIQEINKEDKYINSKQIPLYILETTKMEDYIYKATERKDIMFVAGFQHKPNIDGVVWFAKNIFPKILKKNPTMKFYIVGSNPNKEVLALKSKNIIVTGYVTEKELEEYYSKVKLVVVPLRSGAGVKGKIIESIYHKVPVITTEIGIEGINNQDNLIYVKNSIDEFSKAVTDLYQDNMVLDQISSHCAEFIENYFSKSAAINALDCIDFNNKTVDKQNITPLMKKYAPIALFVYNRLDHPKKVIESLLKNPEAKYTDLYVFSDGGKYLEDTSVINELRYFLKTIEGFNSIKVIERKTNYGLAINLIDGISSVLEKHDKCIVLEDDILVANNFLTFMNQALEAYKNNKKIFTIQSTTGNGNFKEDICCRKHPNCWGWAIWKDRWELFSRNISQCFIDINKNDMSLRREINNNNSINISWQIDANLKSKRNTWGVYLNYTSLKYNKFNIYPKYQMIKNIGEDGSGVHGNHQETSNIVLWNKRIFDLPDNPPVEEQLYTSDKVVEDYNKHIKAEFELGLLEEFLHGKKEND